MRVELEVHHQLGAERLDEAHRGLQPPIGRRVGDDGGVLEVLGADADHHALAVVLPQRRALRRAVSGGSAEPLDAELHGGRSPLSVEHALVEVHRRRTDERGDEHVVGWSYRFCGVSTCCR